MKQILYISFLIVFATAVSSCTKDEIEEPCTDPAMRAVNLNGSEDIQNTQRPVRSQGTVTARNTVEIEVNDDGDDENGNNSNQGKK